MAQYMQGLMDANFWLDASLWNDELSSEAVNRQWSAH